MTDVIDAEEVAIQTVSMAGGTAESSCPPFCDEEPVPLEPVEFGAIGIDETCLVHPDHQHPLQTALNTPVDVDGITADNLEDALAELLAGAVAGAFGSVQVVLDGRGNVLGTGLRAYFRCPYNLQFVRWSLLADLAGSTVINVWRDTYANFPPLVGDAITGTDKPTLSAVSKNQSTALTGWSTTCAEGDVLAINIDSLSTITKLTLELRYQRLP